MKFCVTGRRSICVEDIPIITGKMTSVVSRATVVMFGGARGVDYEALKAASNEKLKLIMSGHDQLPKLVLVCPNRLDQVWKSKEQKRMVDEVIELGNPITSSNFYRSFYQRNEYMVDNTDVCVMFWDYQRKGGTYQCGKYASEQHTRKYGNSATRPVGVEVVKLWVSERGLK